MKQSNLGFEVGTRGQRRRANERIFPAFRDKELCKRPTKSGNGWSRARTSNVLSQ